MSAAFRQPAPQRDPSAHGRRPPRCCGSRTSRPIIRTHYFGVNRDVRAVDGISFDVRAGEIYGLAGESSSGKTTLIKTIAGAIKPPLEVVGGRSPSASCRARGPAPGRPAEVARIRWRHLSYIMQGSMNVLNPLRRVRHTFDDFAFRHMGLARRVPGRVEAHLARVKLDPSVLAAYPHELSGGMRQRVTIALATICRPDSSSPTSRRPRSTWSCRRTCSA